MSQKTLLFEQHQQLQGRLVDFAGWLLPVQYEGIREEHTTVRQSVGIFDVSHMGEIRIKGPNSLAFLEKITTNQVGKLEKNQAQYNLLPNQQGGLVDDIYVYCLETGLDYLLCVNAANDEKDWNWIKKLAPPDIELQWQSQEWSQIAVQGPSAPTLVSRVLDQDVTQLKKNRLIRGFLGQSEFIYACSGYTGEAGGEIFIQNNGAITLWRDLLEKGQNLGVKPCGLGARDTLRTEMGYPLYGHEIDDHLNPFMANLGWVIKDNTKDFIGKSQIIEGKTLGLNSILIGFEMLDKSIARDKYRILSSDQKEIGWVTSGTFSPSLNRGIGLAYVALPFATIGQEILIDIRGRMQKARVVKYPFIQK